ncbi:MAG: mechanosensitive ion channel domain-containing protein [Bacteroidota bacterium]|uniref:Small-conductance mechanosensitive channel n=1 Tax=Christiangramia flava JLT2011 TaxID=1229726 RepID=A0A1L7IAW4_9FLAO|nr:mechanosensitive ion channel domain-containing protein [Christiangramia flava]APU70272.1 Small-conductance mechanosensitive channel [Christiangramia flava JLT2011]MAM17907.1 mechanosensitive ion channel protein MscS [Christiangramia sp.]MEE2773014.1 mechanosensitive ion channel domain-containing protein [Bacteroidota bacterium]OSS39758.1 Small-conductance mechanosensitive channel [Christiangramia flava JLT2011]
MNDIVLNYREELVYSLIVLVILIFIQFILKKAANKVGKKSEINITRTRLMFKYINILVVLIAAFLMALAWGVGIAELALIFSSVFAVIGVALFAIWSILSNITSGIILFFSFPYKIGDTIKIHDKDLPVEAVIEDIKAFHLHLRTREGELITYPNNLILQKAVSLIEHSDFDEGKDAL